MIERYPHTRPSSYIKMGLDATVVYPTINFQIRNAYPFPVVLHQTVKNGVVRAEILGKRRARTITLIRKIDQALPYEELERPDKIYRMACACWVSAASRAFAFIAIASSERGSTRCANAGTILIRPRRRSFASAPAT